MLNGGSDILSAKSGCIFGIFGSLSIGSSKSISIDMGNPGMLIDGSRTLGGGTPNLGSLGNFITGNWKSISSDSAGIEGIGRIGNLHLLIHYQAYLEVL